MAATTPLVQAMIDSAIEEEEEEYLECVGLIEEGSASPAAVALVSAVARRRQRRTLAAVTLGATAVVVTSLGIVAAVGFAVRKSAGSATAEANVDASVGLAATALNGPALVDSMANALQQVGGAGGNLEKTVDWASRTNFSAMNTWGGFFNATKDFLGLQGTQLMAPNTLQDGNPCPDHEEPFEGLCYQRCANLTNGRYPIRTTAFSCCMAEPCGVFNTKFTSPVKLCGGFDVGGRVQGVGCPHEFGDCLLNEEFHLGSCYKKCAMLTSDEYPFRTGANTCCKTNNLAGCLTAENTKTMANFSVGGGQGDHMLQEKAGMVHPPIPELAEATTQQTAQAFGKAAAAAAAPAVAAPAEVSLAAVKQKGTEIVAQDPMESPAAVAAEATEAELS